MAKDNRTAKETLIDNSTKIIKVGLGLAIGIGGTIVIYKLGKCRAYIHAATLTSDMMIALLANERGIDLTCEKAVELGKEVADWLDAGGIKQAYEQVITNGGLKIKD